MSQANKGFAQLITSTNISQWSLGFHFNLFFHVLCCSALDIQDLKIIKTASQLSTSRVSSGCNKQIREATTGTNSVPPVPRNSLPPAAGSCIPPVTRSSPCTDFKTSMRSSPAKLANNGRRRTCSGKLDFGYLRNYVYFCRLHIFFVYATARELLWCVGAVT